MASSLSEVYVLKTVDRKNGIPMLMQQFSMSEFSGKQVALKANYNSSDPFPASTHIDTLRAIISNLKEAKIKSIVLGERSGMGETQEVLTQTGVIELSKELGFSTVILDNLPKEEWQKISRNKTHWIHGFYISKLFTQAQKVVETCCLKTHRFGGHFTLALKCSVGLVAKKVKGDLYDYMWELHGSPFQRQMIAEINNHYRVDAIFMDAIKAFISGGPDKGEEVSPQLLLASRDRVAIDAVGVAILKNFGAKGKIANDPVFEQDQIKRAAELGFGVRIPEEIKLVALNNEAKTEINQIQKTLNS